MGIRHEGGHERDVGMEMDGDDLVGHMMFFEPGEHHLRLHGTPHGHGHMDDIGEHVIHVHRRHHIIGDYWVELEIDPAPILMNQTATVRLYVFDLVDDETFGDPVGGLEIRLSIIDPEGVQTDLTVGEPETGVYEAEHTFGDAGLYELLVAIGPEGQGVLQDEFHIPVLESLDDPGIHHRDHHGERERDHDRGGHGM
jgi:hypothetical protein